MHIVRMSVTMDATKKHCSHMEIKMVAVSSCRSMIHLWYDGIEKQQDKRSRRNRAPPILRDAHAQSKARKRYALFAVPGMGFLPCSNHNNVRVPTAYGH